MGWGAGTKPYGENWHRKGCWLREWNSGHHHTLSEYLFFHVHNATNSNSHLCVEQLNTSGGAADTEGPAWAPLRDNYMLTNSKLKDWDKMPVRYDIFSKPTVGWISVFISYDIHIIWIDYTCRIIWWQRQRTMGGCWKTVVQMKMID